MNREVNLNAPYRRHIVVNNVERVIYIEVQASLNGNLKLQEYHDIDNGQWHKYVPADKRNEFAAAINGGFTVRPMVNTGGMNEQYYIIQIVGVLEDKHHILT
jgi:hypothetical protein